MKLVIFEKWYSIKITAILVLFCLKQIRFQVPGGLKKNRQNETLCNQTYLCKQNQKEVSSKHKNWILFYVGRLPVFPGLKVLLDARLKVKNEVKDF